MAKRPIMLIVFIHNDLEGTNEDLLYQDHFDWLADEIARISGRITDVTFVQPSDAPALSSLDYKTEDLDDLFVSLEAGLLKYINSAKSAIHDNSIYKCLLLTRDSINKTTLGVAYTPGNLGIASFDPKSTAAHEFGHMFNATHQDSGDVRTYWGHAKSVMYATTEKTAAFSFSSKNQENIRNYLKRYG
ncbi:MULTISPECIES: hypothetical protein [unclassified Pseudomonas]|uniref:hypothetical protein n=1 Tax=unclassified Pseudomonas TaxID=196821 RepID=UPI001CBD1E3F|nr:MULTISPECIES: hypothetical protein [unclassified Pseudomonas]